MSGRRLKYEEEKKGRREEDKKVKDEKVKEEKSFLQ